MRGVLGHDHVQPTFPKTRVVGGSLFSTPTPFFHHFSMHSLSVDGYVPSLRSSDTGASMMLWRGCTIHLNLIRTTSAHCAASAPRDVTSDSILFCQLMQPNRGSHRSPRSRGREKKIRSHLPVRGTVLFTKKVCPVASFTRPEVTATLARSAVNAINRLSRPVSQPASQLASRVIMYFAVQVNNDLPRFGDSNYCHYSALVSN